MAFTKPSISQRLVWSGYRTFLRIDKRFTCSILVKGRKPLLLSHSVAEWRFCPAVLQAKETRPYNQAACRVKQMCLRRLESSWNVLAHGDAREGKWGGNWRMEWVASTLHTTSEHGVSSITTADAHTLAASSRLNWRPRRFNPLNAELNPNCHLLALKRSSPYFPR
jgi:hypothetical protein